MFWNLFGMSEVSDLAVTGSGFFITQVTGELLLNCPVQHRISSGRHEYADCHDVRLLSASRG